MIEPYLTYEALLGAGKDDFGLLPVAVIGKSKAEVAAYYKLAVSTDAEINVKLANSKLSSEYSLPQRANPQLQVSWSLTGSRPSPG